MKRNLSNEMEEALRASPEWRVTQLEEQVEDLKRIIRRIAWLVGDEESAADVELMDKLGN